MSCPPLQLFNFDGGDVRVVLVDGQPWWVASDVARVLGVGRAQELTRHLDDDEARGCLVDTPFGGRQKTSVISESGLYSAILRSRKPEAKRFKRWVTGEVLPALRRSGTYSSHEPKTYADALRALANQVEAREAAEAERARAQREVRALTPRAECWEKMASSRGDFAVGQAAKILARAGIDTGPNKLFEQLAELGMVFVRRDRGRVIRTPYQKHIDHLQLRVQTYEHPETKKMVLAAPQVRVTIAGLHWLYKRLGGLGELDPAMIPDLSAPVEAAQRPVGED